jgi:hypothetical protein
MPKWAAIIAGISVIVIIIIACTGADVDPPGIPGDFRPGPRHCFPDGRGPTPVAARNWRNRDTEMRIPFGPLKV